VQLGPNGPRLKLTVEDTKVISLGTRKLKKDFVPVKTTVEIRAAEVLEEQPKKKQGCGGKAAVLLVLAAALAAYAAM
jgi:hypothetical protein